MTDFIIVWSKALELSKRYHSLFVLVAPFGILFLALYLEFERCKWPLAVITRGLWQNDSASRHLSTDGIHGHLSPRSPVALCLQAVGSAVSS